MHLANHVVDMRVRRRNVHMKLDVLVHVIHISTQRPLQLLRGVLATSYCVDVNLSNTNNATHS